MLVTIEVTQEHIDRGARKYCGGCPVALAIAEKVADGVDVRVGGYWVSCQRGDGVSASDIIPGPIQSFIERFDNGASVSPLTFELELRYDFLRTAGTNHA